MCSPKKYISTATTRQPLRMTMVIQKLMISVGAHLSQGKVQKFYYQLERNISELSRKAITKARNDGRVSRRFSGRKYNAFSHDNTSRTIRRFVSARDSSPIKQNSVLARRSMSLSPIPFSPSPECSVDLSKNTTGLDLSAAMNKTTKTCPPIHVQVLGYCQMSAREENENKKEDTLRPHVQDQQIVV
ncbi:hypothetical protein L5515_014847 [Caenorhabditis briggsae]|uniref:Uncharacterized protein n=1 Tax=Caenorhabditis briggsae TaxID=6238 RepID=A0AAE9EFK2_CAEBR|nr:hypothetical protein L5515_014847 [Caenorhabditis briggsae]